MARSASVALYYIYNLYLDRELNEWLDSFTMRPGEQTEKTHAHRKLRTE